MSKLQINFAEVTSNDVEITDGKSFRVYMAEVIAGDQADNTVCLQGPMHSNRAMACEDLVALVHKMSTLNW